MDKPQCPICLQKHYGVDHVWPRGDAPSREPLPVVEVVDNGVDVPTKFDRVAYQRVYMQKYRAAKKAKP